MSEIENHPDLWQALLPRPQSAGHKYDRGHAVILGANELTGATRLCATACSRMGAGLVSVIAEQRGDIYRTTLDPDIMVTEDADAKLRKVSVVVAGPGGASESQRELIWRNPRGAARVLDANAVPGVDSEANGFSMLDARTILTPHEGEFSRAFPDLVGSKARKALAAAEGSGAIIVLKGEDTAIASPDGRCVMNRHASPWLAKAGTGDVLAGMIAGLVAQHMEPYEAACAAVWMHGEAGRRIGPGLIAGDISGQIAGILADLLEG